MLYNQHYMDQQRSWSKEIEYQPKMLIAGNGAVWTLRSTQKKSFEVIQWIRMSMAIGLLKPEITGKHSKNAKNNNPTKNEQNPKYRNAT